jgi:hypothetical protein
MGKLNTDDLLFLDTLCDCGHSHVSDAQLKERLLSIGFSEEKYGKVKMKLLFARYVGSVYGNVTLENKNYRELTAEP